MVESAFLSYTIDICRCFYDDCTTLILNSNIGSLYKHCGHGISRATRAMWHKFTRSYSVCFLWLVSVVSTSERRGRNSPVRTLFAACGLSASCQHQGDVAEIHLFVLC